MPAVQVRARRIGWGSAAALALAVLAGCANGGAMARIEADPTIITGSIGPMTDRGAVERALSDALDEGAPLPVAWENADTGARGAVVSLAPPPSGKRGCRGFTASRENYDGVALHAGEACPRTGGGWVVDTFEAL